MVVCSSEHGLQAEIIFVIEGTAVNGAYINDIKTNYIMPSLEYFSQGNLDDNNYLEDSTSIYGIVVYQAADCLPHPSTDTFGPFTSAAKVYSAIERLELVGGKGESHANIAEGLATALHCFEELQSKRDANSQQNIQKHCILICNSPPYTMPVLESQTYSGKNYEQLAGILQENNINLTVISPRKIPSLYKLFEKAGGDLSASQTKNYAKDPRHLVLLKGFSLKERPISPPPTNNVPSTQQQIQNTTVPIASLPSPGGESPISGSNPNNTNIMGPNANNVVGVNAGQSPGYRPQNTQEFIGVNAMPPHQQGMVQGQKGVGGVGVQGVGVGGRMMGNQQMPIQQINAPPQYHAAGGHRWPMLPPVQQANRPYMQNNPSVNPTTQPGSALIAQLTQPPSTMPGNAVSQFGQINASSPKLINMNQQPNIPSSMPSQPGIQTSMAGIQTSQANPVVTSQAPSPSQPQARERHTIWSGLLEWIEKPKNATTDQQKITKHVPCQVSANTKEGEPELKADGWPPKLIMQLMPKQLIGNIGGAYLKNSKSVLFHPSNCEALESLTRVMSSGFAGCVHFTSSQNSPSCDIKVLILLYTSDKRAYLGFIPNDQAAFVDRLRKVIQQQKSTQQMKQNMGGVGPNIQPGPNGPLTMGGTPPQMGVNNPVSSQSPQQGMMISQTNTLSMGGGQITQNVVTSSGQQNPGMGGVMGQNVPGVGMRPNIRMPGIQQGQAQSNMQQGEFDGMMGGQVQRAPFENQLQVERQQNLEKINQLRQTLEAAQQQEQQYKSQLERISHMKTSQLQEALQLAQQTELQFKMMDQQRQIGGAPGNPQPNLGQQQTRMMRPVMTNNPGLRHLLQQQPQYRQQMINMQQMGTNGPRPQMNQQMPQQGNNQTASFDEVSNFDFM
ncbi:mediator of RNA polymerase II transcription subunit 25 isoform X2 [Aethina tumida]|uniref:mediator of RNA polymerase II transcription subunit 25 isoform X2 n=1 Tax=Aethina tumida TaxID=116153 RepID=UPI00096B0DFA|nr:mediator of RNA polymerase II transcription subunit 25 isoform X2 [Aethina tumida]